MKTVEEQVKEIETRKKRILNQKKKEQCLVLASASFVLLFLLILFAKAEFFSSTQKYNDNSYTASEENNADSLTVQDTEVPIQYGTSLNMQNSVDYLTLAILAVGFVLCMFWLYKKMKKE